MIECSIKSGLKRLCLSMACLLAAASCTNTTPYYSGTSPGGGLYVSVAPPKWEFTNFGLVKLKGWKGLKRTKKTKDSKDSKLEAPDDGDGSYWKGDGVSGKPRLHIMIGEQMAYFYKGDQLVGASPICTGSPEFPTPTGSFSICEKDHDHLSSVYGDYIDKDKNIIRTQIDNRKDPRPPGTTFDGAKMHWFMRIHGAVGMHEGYLPGYADSHGCIRLPTHMAKIFFENTPAGTPVKISE
jgi:hypothetical protein